jgi:hypothetical protein
MAEFRFWITDAGPVSPLHHQFKSNPIHARNLRSPLLNEAVEWCQDVDRPGLFSYSQIGPMGSLFWFTDPNTAFEFRMRWC